MNNQLVTLEEFERRKTGVLRPGAATQPRAEDRSAGRVEWKVLDPITLANQPVPARRWLVDGMIPRGNVTLLSGDGGVGKSLLALQLMTACALGKEWLGRKTLPCKGIGFFCEDDQEELHRRIADILRHEGAEFSDLEDLKLVPRVGLDNLLVEFAKWQDRGSPTALYRKLLDETKAFGAQVIVVDTAADTFGGNENIRPQVRYFVNLLRRLAIETDGAVILTSHPSVAGLASGSGLSGSTAWNNSVRSRLYLTRPKSKDGDESDIDPDARILRGMKSNYGKTGDSIRLRWVDGAFVPEDSSGSGEPIGVSVAAERVFLEGLRTLTEQGVNVSNLPSSNFAPKMIAQLDLAKGVGQKSLGRAMLRLLETKRIRVDLEGPPSRQRARLREVQ